MNQHLLWGRMSGEFGTLPRRSEHPASPILLTKVGPLTTSIQSQWFTKATIASHPFKVWELAKRINLLDPLIIRFTWCDCISVKCKMKVKVPILSFVVGDEVPPGSIPRCLSEVEHIWWYPKDGDLFLLMVKPGETLVEACSDTDVQIVR